MDKTTFILRIVVPELKDRAPPVQRLRAALKALWRGYGVRVNGIRPADDPPTKDKEPRLPTGLG